jgi:pimeloyl-ACP methyl ester carboxylesterase
MTDGTNERLIYLFKTFDGTPEIQDQLPKLWSRPNLTIIPKSIDPTGSDYQERFEETSAEIENHSEEVTVDLLGLSDGGKTALSHLINTPGSINRVAIASTKIDPYNFHNPKTSLRFPNLVSSSELLASYMNEVDRSLFQRVLCLYSASEDVLDSPTDAILDGAAYVLEAGTPTHERRLNYVAQNCGQLVLDFFENGTLSDQLLYNLAVSER